MCHFGADTDPMDELPKTVTGKIQRAALRVPPAARAPS
jgi:acyl-coenzyme A synthetase/AMP-(fatty) acid ligase